MCLALAMTTSMTHGHVCRIEEDLNMEMMLHLKLAFDKADRDKGGGLDLDEFRDAFINRRVGRHQSGIRCGTRYGLSVGGSRTGLTALRRPTS